MNMNETMADTADTAAQKAKPLLDRVSTIAHDAADKAYTMKTDAKDWLYAQGEQMSAKQKEVLDDTAKYIAANPFKAIGIAALAALIAGRLMR